MFAKASNLGKKRMYMFLKYNFDEALTLKDNGGYYDKRILMSNSTGMSPITKLKLGSVPEFVLEQSRVEGDALMKGIEYIYSNKITEIDELPYESEKVKEMVFKVFEKLISSGYRIKAVEKHVSNGYGHGFIDLVVKSNKNQLLKIIEIKTRSSDELRDSDTLQTFLYSKIVGGSILGEIGVLNKKKMEIKTYPMDIKKGQFLVSGMINKPLEIMGLDEYCIPKEYEKIGCDPKLEEVLQALPKRKCTSRYGQKEGGSS